MTMEPCSNCGRDNCVKWVRLESFGVVKWGWVCTICHASRVLEPEPEVVRW